MEGSVSTGVLFVGIETILQREKEEREEKEEKEEKEVMMVRI
jgi:hypothetical protein